MSWLYPASVYLKVKLARFILEAEKFDMPVRFLKRVVSDYDFAIGDGKTDATNTWTNGIHVSTRTLHGLRNDTPRMADEGAVNTFYHEATHAYVDLVDADEGAMWADAMAGYRGAKLRNGKVVDDPDRVVQEAAAEYVGGRASGMWIVLSVMSHLNATLDKYQARQLSGAEVAKTFELAQQRGSLPDLYDRLMRERVFGYQMWSGEQSAIVDRAIPHRLKVWCDSLLEDKIKDRFDLMPTLKHRYDQLVARAAQGRQAG